MIASRDADTLGRGWSIDVLLTAADANPDVGGFLDDVRQLAASQRRAEEREQKRIQAAERDRERIRILTAAQN